MRLLEEWERRQETLRNGKTFDVQQQLRESDQQYRQTRILYNVLTPEPQQRRRAIPPRQRRYTVEDAEFIARAELTEIQTRFNCDLKRAQYLKYQVPRQYGLRLR
jgi:hypothetical protein